MGMRFMRFPGGRAKALTFSYDDGVHPDRRLIDIFNKYGMKGTFNICSGRFASEGTVYPPEAISGALPKSEAYALFASSPHEVAIHGYTHQYMTNLPTSQRVSEILDDRKNLEEMFGRRITGGAYPYGNYNDDVVEALRLCGIKYCRTTVSTESFVIPTDWLRLPATCHHANPRLMELADEFISLGIDRQPRLFYVWGHSYEFNQKQNWNVIEEFCEKMSGNDDIWYATNIEIYDYIEAYNRLECFADGKKVYNPTLYELWVYQDGVTYKIPAGATIEIVNKLIVSEDRKTIENPSDMTVWFHYNKKNYEIPAGKTVYIEE